MDVAILRSRIESTVDPNADARRQAELDLRYVSVHCQTAQAQAKILSQRRKNNLDSLTLYSTYYRLNKMLAYGCPVSEAFLMQRLADRFSCRVSQESSQQSVGAR